MNKNTFSGGVEPGGLRSRQEIKVLICYMFCKIGSMSKENVLSALQEKGLANYFEAGEAFSELVYGGNLNLDKNTGKYTISESGKLISDQLYSSIPLSVRENAVDSGIAVIKRAKIEEENKIKIEQNDFGYNVVGSISGGEFDLLKFSLYVPDINEAEKVKKNFRGDPEALYRMVLSVLTRKKEIGESLKDMLSDLMN